MSTIEAVPSRVQPIPALGIARLAAALALLLAELLVLTVRYDGATVVSRWSGLASLIQAMHYLPQLALAAATATVIVARVREFAALRQALCISAGLHWLPFLSAHVLAFVGFAFLTDAVMEGPMMTGFRAVLLLTAWIGLGASSLAFWAKALAPFAVWSALFLAWRRVLLVGGAAGVAVWTASRSTPRLWEPLAGGTLFLAAKILRLVGLPATADPARFILRTPRFAAAIAKECSGYEGIGLMLGFLTLYLWIFRARLRFPQAWLLLPFGVAAIWLSNAVRIAALVWVGDQWSADLATGGFHSLAGWLAFIGLAIGVMLAVPHCRFLARGEAKEGVDPCVRPPAGYPAAAYLMPLMALIATAMVTGAFSAGFDLAYPLRIVTVAMMLWIYRRSYRDLPWSWSWPAVAIGAAVGVIWLALEPLAGAPSQPQPVWEHVSRPVAVFWLSARVLGSVVTVPLAEELAFRGYLLHKLSGPGSAPASPGRVPWTAAVISSVLFGALHGRWVAGTMAGMAYALAQQRRGALSDAVLAHAVTNAGIALAVLLTGSWSLWS